MLEGETFTTARAFGNMCSLSVVKPKGPLGKLSGATTPAGPRVPYALCGNSDDKMVSSRAQNGGDRGVGVWGRR